MKILILAPSHKSFVSPFLPSYNVDMLPEGYFGAPFIGFLIKQLLDRGHEVVAVTTNVVANVEAATIKEYRDGNFRWIVVPARKKTIMFNGMTPGKILDFYAFERRMLRQVVSAQLPDFVHAHWSYEFAGALRGCNIPHLVTVHDNAYQVLKYLPNLYRFGRLLMSEWILHKVKFASTVSPYMLNYVERRCKFSKVIPNPTLMSRSFEEIEAVVTARCSTITAPKIIMIFNGWDSRKNGKGGLMIFKEVKKNFPEASLHLYGHGTQKNGEACKCAAELGLTDVNFNGPVSHSELLKTFETCHLLIHPSREESFGMVITEAMSFGLPAIGGEFSGAIPWVINNKELLIDLDNFSGAGDTIRNLLLDKERYRRISMDCYENVRTRFSAETVVNQYEKYYQEINKKW